MLRSDLAVALAGVSIKCQRKLHPKSWQFPLISTHLAMNRKCLSELFLVFYGVCKKCPLHVSYIKERNDQWICLVSVGEVFLSWQQNRSAKVVCK